MLPESTQLRDLVDRALAEDLGKTGDVTSAAAVPAARRARGRVVCKAEGVLAGVTLAELCFLALDPEAVLVRQRDDGAALVPGDVVLTVEGSARALLAAERTALNFLQHLSGIATRTRALVRAVGSTGVRILDTRKTLPGLRALQKYAVRVGGGHNHRFGLHDQVLLKNNHFALAEPEPYESVVRRAVGASAAPLIAEARTLEEARAAVRGGADVVLLDNFAPGPALREAVATVRGEAARLRRTVEIEASGGVDLHNAAAFAACGVDRLSVGALTHSVQALDLSLRLEVLA